MTIHVWSFVRVFPGELFVQVGGPSSIRLPGGTRIAADVFRLPDGRLGATFEGVLRKIATRME